MCEMRTCKTCGETKPLEEGFYKTGSAYSHKVHYRHICKHCVSETINKKGKETPQRGGKRGNRNENRAKACGANQARWRRDSQKCYGEARTEILERKTYYEKLL